MDLHLDLDPALPRRVAVEGAIRAAIRSGRLRSSDPLPTTRTLAAQLGIARGTVVEAYAQLPAEGWLSTRQGAPTRVARAGGSEPSPVTPSGPYPAGWAGRRSAPAVQAGARPAAGRTGFRP